MITHSGRPSELMLVTLSFTGNQVTVIVTERPYPAHDRQVAGHASRRHVHAVSDDALRALEEMSKLCLNLRSFDGRSVVVRLCKTLAH